MTRQLARATDMSGWYQMFDWKDLVVLAGVGTVVAGRMRRLFAIASVLMFTVAFPPFSWPVWWLCLAPLVWIWRDQSVDLSSRKVAAEAVLIGFAMGWVSTRFVGAGVPAWGWLIHAMTCLLFSLQFVGAAFAIRSSMHRPVLTTAIIAALAATAGEIFEAACGVTWSVTNLALTVGSTPLAQWSRWITPFGVSGGLYVVNFLLIPDESPRFPQRCMGPAMGVAILGMAWFGGTVIAENAATEPLPFSVLLVQPHSIPNRVEPYQPWLALDRSTRAALGSGDRVDLIVWPETCVSETWSDRGPADRSDITTRLTVHDYARLLTPVYSTNSLVGAVVAEVGTTEHYGLDVSQVRKFNCGCLVSTRGHIARHEKLELVPLKEAIPKFLDFDWLSTLR